MAALIEAALSQIYDPWRAMAGYDFSPGRPTTHFCRVASSNSTYTKPTPKSLPQDWPVFCELVPELKEYSFPSLTPKEQTRLLVEQFDNRHTVNDPEVEVAFAHAIDALFVPFVGTVEPPVWTRNKHCLPQPSDVLDLYASLSKTAGPGFPYHLQFTLKHTMFLEEFPFIYSAVCNRLLAYQHLDVESYSTVELVEMFVHDPVTVKIKNEMGKWGSKSPRLIYCVTIVDFLIEALLFGPAVEPVKDSVGEYHSMIGVGFTEEHATMISGILARNGTTLSTDVPKFDTSMAMYENTTARRAYITVYRNPDPRFVRTMCAQIHCAIRPMYYISNGLLLVPTDPGGQISGGFLTSMGNTPVRSARSVLAQLLAQIPDLFDLSRKKALACLVDNFMELYVKAFGEGHPLTRSAGDDNFEKHHPQLILAYEIIGYKIKDAEVSEDTLSFCSHSWGPGVLPVSNRIVKGFGNLVSGAVTTSDQMFAFQTEYGNHPRYEDLLTIALCVRQRANSQSLDAVLPDTDVFEYRAQLKSPLPRSQSCPMLDAEPKMLPLPVSPTPPPLAPNSLPSSADQGLPPELFLLNRAFRRFVGWLTLSASPPAEQNGLTSLARRRWLIKVAALLVSALTLPATVVFFSPQDTQAATKQTLPSLRPAYVRTRLLSLPTPGRSPVSILTASTHGVSRSETEPLLSTPLVLFESEPSTSSTRPLWRQLAERVSPLLAPRTSPLRTSRKQLSGRGLSQTTPTSTFWITPELSPDGPSPPKPCPLGPQSRCTLTEGQQVHPSKSSTSSIGRYNFKTAKPCSYSPRPRRLRTLIRSRLSTRLSTQWAPCSIATKRRSRMASSDTSSITLIKASLATGGG